MSNTETMRSEVILKIAAWEAQLSMTLLPNHLTLSSMASDKEI